MSSSTSSSSSIEGQVTKNPFGIQSIHTSKRKEITPEEVLKDATDVSDSFKKVNLIKSVFDNIEHCLNYKDSMRLHTISSAIQYLITHRNELSLITEDENSTIIKENSLDVLTSFLPGRTRLGSYVSGIDRLKQIPFFSTSQKTRILTHYNGMFGGQKTSSEDIIAFDLERMCGEIDFIIQIYKNISTMDHDLLTENEKKKDNVSVALTKEFHALAIEMLDLFVTSLESRIEEYKQIENPVKTAADVLNEFTSNKEHILHLHLIDAEALVSPSKGLLFQTNSFRNAESFANTLIQNYLERLHTVLKHKNAQLLMVHRMGLYPIEAPFKLTYVGETSREYITYESNFRGSFARALYKLLEVARGVQRR